MKTKLTALIITAIAAFAYAGDAPLTGEQEWAKNAGAPPAVVARVGKLEEALRIARIKHRAEVFDRWATADDGGPKEQAKGLVRIIVASTGRAIGDFIPKETAEAVVKAHNRE